MPATIPDWAKEETAAAIPDWATSDVPEAKQQPFAAAATLKPWKLEDQPVGIRARSLVDIARRDGISSAGKAFNKMPVTARFGTAMSPLTDPIGLISPDMTSEEIQPVTGLPAGIIPRIKKASESSILDKALPPIEINDEDSRMSAIGKEAYNIAIGVPKFLTSPQGVGFAGLAKKSPVLVQRLFQGDMGKNLGQQILSNYQNWDKMTEAQKGTAIADMIGTGTFLGLLTLPDVLKTKKTTGTPVAPLPIEPPATAAKPPAPTVAAIKPPQPDWQVSVQSPKEGVPGYVQIVDPRQTETDKSPTVESLRAAGHDIPDFSKLPQGKYAYADAIKLATTKSSEISSKLVVPKTETLPTQMFVRVEGGKVFPISSYEEASNKFGIARDAVFAQGGGSAEIPHVDLVDSAGNAFGYVSQNGRVWLGKRENWKQNKVVYEPGGKVPSQPAKVGEGKTSPIILDEVAQVSGLTGKPETSGASRIVWKEPLGKYRVSYTTGDAIERNEAPKGHDDYDTLQQALDAAKSDGRFIERQPPPSPVKPETKGVEGELPVSPNVQALRDKLLQAKTTDELLGLMAKNNTFMGKVKPHEQSWLTEAADIRGKELAKQKPAVVGNVSKPKVVAVTNRSRAAEFNKLVMDNAPAHKWAQDKTLEDALTPKAGKDNLGSAGITGNIRIGKAINTVLRQVAKDLGLDPDQIGSEKYRAQHLDKLKQFIGQKEDFDKATKGGDVGGKMPVPANELAVGETLDVDGEPVKVTAIHRDHVELEDGRKFGIQRVDKGETLYVEGYEPFSLEAPETTDAQRVRLAKEQEQRMAMEAEQAKAEQVRAKATGRIGGDLGTAGQGGLFAEPGQREIFQTKPPEGAGMAGPGSPSRGQGADIGGAWQEGNGGDIYGVAQRVREARAKAGQVAPVQSGEGVSVEAAVEWGRQILANGGDAEKALRQFESDKKTSFDLIAVTRAKGEELAQAARGIEEKFGTDSKEYRMAQKVLSDWDTRTKAIQTEWHKQGMAQQGETDLDTGSFTGIQRAFKDVTGGDLPASHIPKAKKIASGVAKAEQAVEPAKLNLQNAIDNFDERGAPIYSDYVLKLAEKIVSKLDARAEASRQALREMSMRFSAGIDPTVFGHLANIGASHIAHFGLDFVKWSDAMIRDVGPKVKPYLKDVFARSQELVDGEANAHGINAEKVKGVVKKTGVKRSPADLATQQQTFGNFESGQPMNPEQVKTLWQRAKSEYIDKGNDDQMDIVHKLAEDLGIPAKDVLRGLAQNKSIKRVADDVWQKQRHARMLKASAKRWVEHAQETALSKVMPAAVRVMFSMKVGLHGTVAIGTHSALTVATHPVITANNFGKMYKLVVSPEYFRMQQYELARRDNYTVAQRNGLVNDMSKMEDFNDPRLVQGFPKMAAWFKKQLDKVHLGRLSGMGTRGYSVLKILRQDLFDHEWNKLAESKKTDEMAKAIADSVNHMTGVVKAGSHPAANVALFAPKLMLSRLSVIVGDPYRAINSMTKMSNMTPAEKWFAVNQFKEKAKIFAVATGLLYANQQLNNLFGDKKKLNGIPEWAGGGGWNPMASDFMKFRVAGMNFAWGSPFLTMMRLPLRIVQIGMGDGGKAKYLIYPDESMSYEVFKYARTQTSPFMSPIITLVAKSDYQGRPLPKIPGYGEPPPMKKRLQAEGIKPYTWTEFALQTALPIPFQEGAKEVFHYGFGLSPKQEEAYLKAFITVSIMGATGGRLSEDWNKDTSVHFPSTKTPPTAAGR
jgi:hypothetical protein